MKAQAILLHKLDYPELSVIYDIDQKFQIMDTLIEALYDVIIHCIAAL